MVTLGLFILMVIDAYIKYIEQLTHIFIIILTEVYFTQYDKALKKPYYLRLIIKTA